MLVRRSGQDSTAFECRVLAANRNPVADPMPAKPCSPCPNSTACCRCPTRPCTLPPEARGATQFPTIGLFERTRAILKEPETRRLKNRGHLARNRKFESISLQQTVCLSPANVFEGREPRLSARGSAAGLATGSAETRRVFQFAPVGGNISVGPYSSTALPLNGADEGAR